MKRIFKVLTVASLFALYSCNETRREQDQDTNEIAEESNEERFEDSEMEKDADFVANAVASNYAEIEMAQLAQERSSNPEVKAIAKMLEEDHAKTLSELKTLAQSKSITVPIEAKEEAKNDMQKLRDETGTDFDKKWLDKVEDMHEKSVNKFEKKAENGEDAEIKAFAAKTLPTLKMHKEKIDATREQLKDNDSAM